MAKRKFSTASVVAMADQRLGGLHWRLYLWVSLHDGMSLEKGKGAGCFASNKTLFAKAGCDNYSSGCRALSQLVEWGHLDKSKHGRATTYRVKFPDPNMLQTGNQSIEMDCGEAIEPDAIGCMEISETPGKLPKTAQDYSPLSGELDSVETGGLDSAKQRDLKSRDAWADENLPIGARLQRLELALKGHPESCDLEAMASWLDALFYESEEANALHHQIFRLSEDVLGAMTEEQFQQHQNRFAAA